MPFFHDQDREGLRRHYLEAWRRHQAGAPLEPLQHQLVTVIEQHPEYQPLFEDDPQALGRDYTPEAGQSNPFLHLGLHLAIREQVATNRPAGVAAVHRELSRQLGDVHASAESQPAPPAAKPEWVSALALKKARKNRASSA